MFCGITDWDTSSGCKLVTEFIRSSEIDFEILANGQSLFFLEITLQQNAICYAAQSDKTQLAINQSGCRLSVFSLGTWIFGDFSLWSQVMDWEIQWLNENYPNLGWTSLLVVGFCFPAKSSASHHPTQLVTLRSVLMRALTTSTNHKLIFRLHFKRQ